MTLKALLNLADAKEHLFASERYHSSPGWHGHSSSGHGGSWKSKSGTSGAAISALALLAFLFFLNTMQQTMMDSTMMDIMNNMDTPTIIVRNTNEKSIGDRNEIKNKNKFPVESDNTFWNSQRLEVESYDNKNLKNN